MMHPSPCVDKSCCDASCDTCHQHRQGEERRVDEAEQQWTTVRLTALVLHHCCVQLHEFVSMAMSVRDQQ